MGLGWFLRREALPAESGHPAASEIIRGSLALTQTLRYSLQILSIYSLNAPLLLHLFLAVSPLREPSTAEVMTS